MNNCVCKIQMDRKNISFLLVHLSCLWVRLILEMDWCSWSDWERRKDLTTRVTDDIIWRKEAFFLQKLSISVLS